MPLSVTIDENMPMVSSSFMFVEEGAPRDEVEAFLDRSEASLRARGFEITERTSNVVCFRTTVSEALRSGFSREAVASYVFGALYAEHQQAIHRDEIDYFELQAEVYRHFGAEIP
jgi:hypothetical protein